MSPLSRRLPPALLLCVLAAVPAFGSEVLWSAEVGLGATVVPGSWAPLRITADKADGPWTLTVTGTSVARTGIRIGVFEFPGPGVFERPVFLADGVDALTLRRTEGPLVREEKVLDLAPLGFPGHLILTDGVGTPVRRTLAELLLPQEPLRVVSVPASRWPATFLAYGSVSALVVQDPGPVLSPVQAQALRAWIASGGRLAVLSPRSDSILGQVGPDTGWGRAGAVDAPGLPGFLGLEPYGTRARLGTDFGPPAKNLPPGSGPDHPAALVLLGLWALALAALSRRKSAGIGLPLALSSLATAAVLVLSAAGFLDWDRGLEVHSRQVFLPAGAGAVTSVEAALPQARTRLVDWPEASPWALELWKAAHTGPGTPSTVKSEAPGRLVLETFTPPVPRTSDLRVRWTGAALQWTRGPDALEAAPPGYHPDLPWIARITSAAPGTEWAVGLDNDGSGTLCWVRPLPGGRS